MQKNEEKNQCAYDLAILRARINIRDYYANTATSTIYESTGQLLSLIRIRLALIENNVQANLKETVIETSGLAGKAIRDLRELSRNFYPENELVKEGGFVRALQEVTGILFKNPGNKIEINGTVFLLPADAVVLLFSLTLEILSALRNENYGNALQIKIHYIKTKISIALIYTGDFSVQLNSRQLKTCGVKIKKKKDKLNTNEILISLSLTGFAGIIFAEQ